MLMQLQANKQADERLYAQIIRETLLENEGHTFPRRTILDPSDLSSLTGRKVKPMAIRKPKLVQPRGRDRDTGGRRAAVLSRSA